MIANNTAQHRRARLAHRRSRQEIFDMLHTLRQQGLNYSEITQRTRYERKRSRIGSRPTRPETEIGRHLLHDIKKRGYTGSRSILERPLTVWRETEKDQPDDAFMEAKASDPVPDPETGYVISSMVAAAL